MTIRFMLLSAMFFALAMFACAENESSMFLYLKAAQLEQDGRTDEAFRAYQQVLSKESSPTVYIKMADLEFKRNNINSALSILERAGKEYPENTVIAFRMGTLCIEKARQFNNSSEEKNRWLNDAEKAFKFVIEKEPNEQHLVAYAYLAIERNDTKAAIDCLLKALELNPDMPEVSLSLGELYKNENDYGNAIRFYMQTADRMEGRMRLALLKQIGGLALEKKDFNIAFDAYRAALRDNEDDPYLYYMAGYAAGMSELRTEAQQVFDAGLEKFPDYAMLRKRSALNLIVLGKPKEAVAVIEKIDELERDMEYYVLLSNAYAEIPDRAKALATAEKGLEENPHGIELYLVIAAQYEKDKKYEDCITVLKKALEVEPDSASVQNFLGYLYADLNRNLDEAELLLNRALAKEPDNYAYLDSKAWLLYRKGKYQEAYDLIQKAIAINPDDPEVLEHLEHIRKKLSSGKIGGTSK